jgi:hypothetical protein
MVNTFAHYGYAGVGYIPIPNGSVLASCDIIQKDAVLLAYSHSIAIDSQFIYLAITTSDTINGYNDGTYLFHLQKIDKNTFITAGDVTIPKCTDDMVQNGEFVFLAPEYSNATPDIYGSDFGLIAIRKSNLEIKYLKALHKEFNTINEIDRQCYGVFYFNGRIIVQLVNSKKSVVINTATVENWDASFPIGGATEAVYKFQKNGVDLTLPPNEFVIDSNNWAHISDWGTPTDILKFPLSSFDPGIVNVPNIETRLISLNGTTGLIGGYILNEGKSAITSGGFKWGTTPEDLTTDLPADPFSYDFQEALTNLAPGIYYVKAYGTNTEGTFYGNTVIFSVAANAVSLHNTDTIALLEFLDTHFGCSIRCVQDAPGVATGTTGTAQDQDGNVYDTVVINEKRWMVQNLKTTHFRNGDPIPNITAPEAWEIDEIGAQCAYNNKPANV